MLKRFLGFFLFYLSFYFCAVAQNKEVILSNPPSLKFKLDSSNVKNKELLTLLNDLIYSIKNDSTGNFLVKYRETKKSYFHFISQENNNCIIYSSDIIDDDISFENFKKSGNETSLESLNKIVELKNQNHLFVLDDITTAGGKSPQWYQKDIADGHCLAFYIYFKFSPNFTYRFRFRLYRYKNAFYVRDILLAP